MNEEANPHLKETTKIGDKIYHNWQLREYGEKHISTTEVSVDSIAAAIGQGHRYWEAEGIEPFGPAELMKMSDQERRSNPVYQEHWEKILRSDLNDPIFITGDGVVFDGVHRLARAVIEKKSTIKVKVFSKEDLDNVISTNSDMASG